MPSQITKAVVIALDDSPRIDGFLASNWGIPFEVFPAVDTRQGDFPPSFDIEVFRERYNREPRNGEVGCVLSHFSIIEEFASSDGADSDLILIAEDDARPTEDFSLTITDILATPPHWDLVLLSEPIYGSEKNLKYYAMSPFSRRVGHEHRLGSFFDKIAGTGLYLMTRASCRKYIANVQTLEGVSWTADDYRWSNGDPRLPHPYDDFDLKVVRPGLADWEGETTIQAPSAYAAYAQRKLERMRLPRFSEIPKRTWTLLRQR